MSGSRIGPTRRASTPIPPANANANGRKPAARRACEIETRSDSDVKRYGTSIAANTASEPPTTYAAHRRRAAKPASGIMSSAAIATAPARVNTSAARLYDVSEWITSWLPYWSNARWSSSASGETERVSFTIGRSQSMKSAAGTTSAPSASAPGADPSAPTARARPGSRRTGSRGRSRRSGARPRARSRRRPSRRRGRATATAPTRARAPAPPGRGAAATTWPAARGRRTRPPMPGANAIIATCALAVTPAAHVRRKSAHPASNATSTASGARIDGRCVTTRSGSSPESFAISARKPCQSGKA